MRNEEGEMRDREEGWGVREDGWGKSDVVWWGRRDVVFWGRRGEGAVLREDEWGMREESWGNEGGGVKEVSDKEGVVSGQCWGMREDGWGMRGKRLWIRIRQNDADLLDPDPQHCSWGFNNVNTSFYILIYEASTYYVQQRPYSHFFPPILPERSGMARNGQSGNILFKI